MFLFNRPNLQFHAPSDLVGPMRPLIAKLLADDADGATYRCAIRHWEWSERPVAEQFIGRHNALRIDGPLTEVGRYSFPMGGMINGLAGWRQLDPIETNELLFDLRAEIDVTINRWLLKNDNGQPPVWGRPEMDRNIEDPQAIARMVAWAHRENRIEALHAARV